MNSHPKYIYILFFCSFFFYGLLSTACSQDIQLTQYYAAPLYANPGYTGIDEGTRITANYRNQWYQLPVNYVTHMASFDHRFRDKPISLGLLLKNDLIGPNADLPIYQNSVHFSVAYLLKVSKKIYINSSIQGGVIQSTLNYANFVFGDQIDNLGNMNGTAEALNRERIFQPDISFGSILYSDQWWLGAAFMHLNAPRYSFLGEQIALPLKVDLQAGYVIPFEYNKRRGYLPTLDNKTLTVTLQYKFQGASDQLSLGVYGYANSFMLGLWYRGLPIKENSDLVFNQDALALLTGYRYKNLQIGYSYDIALSNLPLDKASSHEISLSITFNEPKPYREKPPKRIKVNTKCPRPFL
ncbi:PorP/SprF family type IX secretion system membrane protein [Algivirga pacifica]|uniref:Type IX secretion system membrane protein, PorP/SprF family n=1 Tax=Algivirga pacifica TaxID=1162670 RepID=A0ABP9D914_9BACT